MLEVLGELGVVEGEEGERPCLSSRLWNKWDLLDDERRAERRAAGGRRRRRGAAVGGDRVRASMALLQRLGEMLDQGNARSSLDHRAGERRPAYRRGSIRTAKCLTEEEAGEGVQGPLRRIEVRLTDKELGRFEALDG